MDQTAVLALAAFALVSSLTPGPNNLMLMASGANFGLRATLPHMAGVALGFVAMVAGVGVGLVGMFDRWPVLHDVLKVVSIAYMLWLAWKIARAGPPGDGRAANAKPMTFVQAALFQWVNPKAWAMALTAVTVYAPDREVATVLLIAGVFGAVNLPAVGSWALAGRALKRWLSSRTRLRAFNWTMAALLVASLGIAV